MAKSGANTAAIDAINAGRDVPIMVRQFKYLNNIVGQDHRAIKRVTRPMLNFKSFRAAGSLLGGASREGHLLNRHLRQRTGDIPPTEGSPGGHVRWNANIRSRHAGQSELLGG